VWHEYLDRFFPVNIEAKADVLVIEDRRFSDSLVLSVALAAGSLFFTALLYPPLNASGIYWPLLLFLVPAAILSARSLLLPFREKYVLDKSKDTYAFTRRSVLKSQTTVGSLSEIRAVQIERTTATTDNETREIFRVALLLRQGLLLGSSDVLLLREAPTVVSRYETEARIGYAIANFLQLAVPETISM
jgi:hypothetical protein